MVDLIGPGHLIPDSNVIRPTNLLDFPDVLSKTLVMQGDFMPPR